MKLQLENAPEGSLHLGKSNGVVQYYHRKKATPLHGKYIPKKDIGLVKQLAQKSYDEKILQYTEKTAAQLHSLLREFEEDKIQQIYLSEHPERQKFIIPVEPTFAMKLEEWMAVSYQGKGFTADIPVITTNGGIRVRSKSEKIMADYFESIGLVYKYECPLNLKPFGVIYPDFTFLSKKTGKEIYWEHEGMMDNPDYAKHAVQKIELYEKNNIFPGENLILSFEYSTSTVNMELVKSLTNRYRL